MGDARRPGSDAVTIATRAHAHEALFRAWLDGLSAYVARLALGILGAFLDRGRYGLRVVLLRIAPLGAAAFLDFSTELVMATLFPVFFLARRPAVGRSAAATLLAPRAKRDAADGAGRQEHRPQALGQPWLAGAQAHSAPGARLRRQPET